MTCMYISVQLLPLGDAMAVFFTNNVTTSLAAYLFGLEPASWSVFLGCITSTGMCQLYSGADDSNSVGFFDSTVNVLQVELDVMT